MILVLNLEGERPVARQVAGDYDRYRFSSVSAACRHAARARYLAAHGDEDSAHAAWLDFESVYSELTA